MKLVSGAFEIKYYRGKPSKRERQRNFPFKLQRKIRKLSGFVLKDISLLVELRRAFIFKLIFKAFKNAINILVTIH